MKEIESLVIDLANKHFGDNWKISNAEIKPEFCPLCHGGENRDRYTFSINMETGAWNCKRGSCSEGNKGGGLKDLQLLLGDEATATTRILKNVGNKKKKKFTKPNPDDIHEVTEDIITFFASRKISEQTVRDWKIGSDKDGNIVFPFYRDNELTFVKYRKPKKHTKEDGPKEWRMNNTESILFGMDMVSFNKPLIITEGQLDAMSLYEAGCTNVVSVPSGANDMDWIANCWSWLNNFKWFILFGDNDDAGLTMMATVMSRLGEDRCMMPGEYPELALGAIEYGRPCKDANEILYAYGPEVLKELVDSCEPSPVTGIIDLAKMPHMDMTKMPRIMTRIPGLDNKLGGLCEGGITIMSGKRGSGKSTLVGPIMLNAVEQGYKCCLYSGELAWHKVKSDLWLQATERKYVGYRVDPLSGKNIPCISEQIEERINQWLEGKIFVYDNDDSGEGEKIDRVMKVFEACARRFGCKLFTIDNLLMLVAGADDTIKQQAKIVARLKSFATKYKVHVIVVSHPRKELPGASMGNDSVSGSSAITDLADNVLFSNRPNISITKNRNFGEIGEIECTYDPCNRRVYQTSVGDKAVYSWDHNGIEAPDLPACDLPEFSLQEQPKIEQNYKAQKPF